MKRASILLLAVLLVASFIVQDAHAGKYCKRYRRCIDGIENIDFDVEDGSVTNREYVENTFTGHARGLSGADHSVDRHGPILEALKGCKAVIAHGMGRRIYDDLRSVNIEAFIVKETRADEAIRLYLQNRLQDHPGEGCRH